MLIKEHYDKFASARSRYWNDMDDILESNF